jgi:hypothetical protein
MATTHCVDRFWERAASGCTTFRAALERLRRLASQAGAFADPPEWAGELAAERYVALGDAAGLVVIRGELAVTCLARGIIGDASANSATARGAGGLATTAAPAVALKDRPLLVHDLGRASASLGLVISLPTT